MGDNYAFRACDDISSGMLVQSVTRRGFPRFWRKRFVGVKPAKMANSKNIVGVAGTNAFRGDVVKIQIRGLLSAPCPPKLTRWQRVMRYLERG